MSSSRIQAIESFQQHRPVAKTLILLPTYNERENIEAMLEALNHAEPSCDVLVIDDNSPDNTADHVGHLAPSLGYRVYLMRRAQKFGLGIAYLDAYTWALDHCPEYETFVQMDADFSHDPRMLPLLISQSQAYGVAVGSRYVQGGATPDWKRWRLWLSRLGNLYMRMVLRIFFPAYQLKDSTSGFVSWRRDVLQAVMAQPVLGDGYAYQTSAKLVAFRSGYPAIEVPIIFRDRRLGVSKLSRNIILEAFVIPWKLGWRFSTS